MCLYFLLLVDMFVFHQMNDERHWALHENKTANKIINHINSQKGEAKKGRTGVGDIPAQNRNRIFCDSTVALLLPIIVTLFYK